TPQKREEAEEIIVQKAGEIIKSARQKKGITLSDFARSMNEKESTLAKIEKGTLTPPLNLAKKIEKALNISIIESYTPEKAHGKTKSQTMTIGDLINIKKH
ncbi:TIGR00270 family protein, partial [Candidatus Woesearchaeota archaeon]